MINFHRFKLTLISLLLLTTFAQGVPAKRVTSKAKKQTVVVKTNNPEIECTIDFASKIEAQAIFQSTGSVNGDPKDTFVTVTNTNYVASDSIFGLQTGSAQSTKTSHLTNGFSNLHNRYLIGKVTIKNNSQHDISISNPLLTNEEYIIVEGMEFTSVEEILQRYITPSLLAHIGWYTGAGCCGMMSFATLIGGDAPLGGRLFSSIFCGLLTYGCVSKIKQMKQHIKAKQDFKDQRMLIDGEQTEDALNHQITIAPGEIFNDFIFINKATYKNAEQRFANAESELLFEISL